MKKVYEMGCTVARMHIRGEGGRGCRGGGAMLLDKSRGVTGGVHAVLMKITLLKSQYFFVL